MSAPVPRWANCRVASAATNPAGLLSSELHRDEKPFNEISKESGSYLTNLLHLMQLFVMPEVTQRRFTGDNRFISALTLHTTTIRPQDTHDSA